MEKDKSRKKAEMVPGTLDILILKTLERNREPMDGYGISLYLRRITNVILQSEWAMSEKNLRARFYKLTPGKKQLRQEVADFDRMLEAILLVVRPTGGGA